MKSKISLWMVMFVALSVTTNTEAKHYKLFYLGGQSNMDGYGYVKDLPDELKGEMKDVMIFHGNTAADKTPVDGRGKWSTLRPGHGVGFKSDGEKNHYSNRFGVELTFAKRLKEQYPDQAIAIIKYSRGGTSIHQDAARQFGCWAPDFQKGEGKGKGINQYDHFLATVRHAMKVQDIDGDGELDTLEPVGILWMQGESDAAVTVEIAKQYEANLKRLMDLIRAAFRQDDIPVVIGRISDSGKGKEKLTWPFGEIVRKAQAMFVEKDVAAGLVTSTDNYGYSDPWHYDSAGYIDFGKQFAEVWVKITEKQKN